jgi:phosphoserine phosphatase
VYSSDEQNHSVDFLGHELTAMTLVAFDFDGTLSDSEMTVLLGEQCGAADRMDEITTRAMNDEIEYAESLRQRCALLDGLSTDRAQDAFDQVRLRPEADTLLSALDDAGVYTAILTGGFERGVRAALETEGVTVDTVVANRLPVADGALTGGVEGPLIEGTKDDALDVLCSAVGEDRSETVAVGDGANDLPMLETAGLAVGYDPKPAVEPACDVVVDSMRELTELFESEAML